MAGFGVTRELVRNGIRLPAVCEKLARMVEVQYLSQVMLLSVDSIPVPTQGLLAEFAAHHQILQPGTFAGLTVGHGIFLVKGEETSRLVSHELRHVRQYEVEGGIEGFIPRYLAEIDKHGYHDAPLEVDARAWEIPVAPSV
jgi:hypothetical protein